MPAQRGHRAEGFGLTASGTPLLVGLDIGTTHLKAGVYRPDGTALVERRTATPDRPDVLRDTALRLVEECVAPAPSVPVALGIASMAETGVTLDAAGEPAGPLWTWRDTRTAVEAGLLSTVFDGFSDVTGLTPTPKRPVTWWMWLRQHRPDILDHMRVWAGAADLVAAALTGAVVTSPSLAARSGVVDLYTGEYRADLLALAGLRADQLPRVVPVGGTAGRVNRTGSTRTGLPTGTPVVIAGHDHLVAAYAVGVRGPGHSADSMGTAEAVVSTIPAPPPPGTVGPTGATVGPFVDGSSYCLISGLPASGALVRWLVERFAPPGTADPYGWLAAALGTVPGPPTGIIVQPYLAGRTAPQPDLRRRLSIHGLSARHTNADIARAVLEGLSMQARWMLDNHTALAGVAPGPVHAFGGAAAQPAWLRMKAQLTPAPLRALSGVECAAIGAAQLAARALGLDHPPLTASLIARDLGTTDGWDRVYRDGFLPLVTR